MSLIAFATIALYGVLVLSLAAALGAVLLRNIFHSALCLVGTLVGVAVIYFSLHAEFIAVVQILLYVGAVMTLVIFAIMLTHRIGDQTIPQANNQSLPAFLALGGFVVLMATFLLKSRWSAAPSTTLVNTLILGEALLGEYVFPFEVISVILIAALIGALVIARRD